MKRFILTVIILSSYFFFDLFGQGTTTVRVRVVRGARLDFIFNSLSRYTDGMTYTDFTKIDIYYNDTVGVGVPNSNCTGWELTVKALQPQFEGDMSAQILDLATIVFSVKRDGIDAGTFTLSNAEQVIASDVFPNIVNVNEEILITYNCGTLPGNNLMNKMPDYYNVDLVFNLTKLF